MQTLHFEVKDQTITQPPGQTVYRDDQTKLQFSFSEDWDGFVRVAGFSRGTEEFEPQALLHGTTCEIPSKALEGSFFRMYVIGKNGTEKRKTKTCIVMVSREKHTL